LLTEDEWTASGAAEAPTPILPANIAAYKGAGYIPTGLTFVHGRWYGGKSHWLYALGLTVAAADDVKFDGMDVAHGGVCYVTLDPGASVPEIKADIIKVRERLGLPKSGRFRYGHDPVKLNLDASLEHFLHFNADRLPCRVLIIDSLYSATAGDLSNPSVMGAVIEGLQTILRRGLADAIICAAQERKDGELYGAIVEQYGASGILSLTFTDKGAVTVTPQKAKGAKPGDPLRYKRADDGFLERIEASHAVAAVKGTIAEQVAEICKREGISASTYYRREAEKAKLASKN